MKLIKFINPENVSEEEVKNFSIREAGSAVVIDDEGKIALLHVSNDNYYKLPGGGIEEGEDIVTAVARECMEETGCEIEIIDEIGFSLEYIKLLNLKQTSYCYLTKVKGIKGVPNFTNHEKEKGFRVVWLSYEDAIKNLIECQTIFSRGHSYVVPRDIAFLEEAGKLII